MSSSSLAGLSLATAVAFTLASPARADNVDERATGARGSAEINTATATAGYQIPLDLPAFRGLPPSLSLRYGSSGGNGWLGLGWSLSGIGVIERAGPRGGSPRWDRSDTFTLDGEPLVACRADAPSPSAVSTAGAPPTITPGSPTPGCAAGATHATRVESYRRIVYDPATDRFTVTEPSGLRRIYAATHVIDPQRRWRYGLVEIADLRDNRVLISWIANPFGCCQMLPSKLTYDQHTVELIWQARPAGVGDLESTAISGGLEARHARLGALAVKSAGVSRSAYRFDYATSVAHGRSLLTRVTQYGRDYQLGSGTVTGGTSLPPFHLRYADAATTDYRLVATSRPAGYVTNPDSFQTADLDGDGRADLLHTGGHVGRRIVSWRGRADGTLAQPVSFDPGASADFSRGAFYPVDIDGDARADLVQLPGGWGGSAWTSRGDGTYASVAPPGGAWYCDTAQCRNQWSTMVALPADVDGDGRSDFLFAETRSPYTGPLGGPSDPSNIRIDRLRVALSRGAAGALSWPSVTTELAQPLTLASSASCGSYTCTSSGALLTGDADGDGRTDLFFVEEG
jgi:Salmonella virulence plasmid 65kDa B protein/FG-GAP-like repeat